MAATALSLAVDALAYGMALFVICVGLSVTMGLMRLVNLAHGAFAMIGGYLASALMLEAGFGFTAALIGAVLGAALVALPVEIALLRPIYGHPNPLNQVVLTIGIAFVIIGLLNLGFGPSVKNIATPDWMSGPVDIGFRNVAGHRIAVIGAGLGIALALKLLIDHTGFGLRVRAIAENPDMAAALGIRTQLVRSAAFALGVGLAALGAVLGAAFFPIEPYYALRHMVTFLVVVALAATGSISRTLGVALVLGAVDTVGRYVAPDLGPFFFYLAVIAMIWLVPHGPQGHPA
jgi:branched-chain amino acid transport system permease protein